MNKKRLTRIFALVRGESVFIGRCAAQKLSTIVRSHCRGEHLQTEEYFDLETKRPELYVLDEVDEVSPITYRHLLAWVHVFDQAGYEVINRAAVLERAWDLRPETRKIVDKIMEQPLEFYLAQGHCADYKAADRQPVPADTEVTQQDPALATERLSVRLTKAEMEGLKAFASDRNLTMRQVLPYLLSTAIMADGSRHKLDSALQQVQDKYQQTVARLKLRDAKLCGQIDVLKEKNKLLREQYVKHADAWQQGIQKYLSYFESSSLIPMELEKGRYKPYREQSHTEYHFPKEEGFAVIRPAAVLYGKSQGSRFIVGTTDQGEPLKLRYYPNKQFLGRFLTDEAFGLRGSCWLVGWEKTSDGAMQLNFALPLSVRPKYEDPMTVPTELDKLMQEVDRMN